MCVCVCFSIVFAGRYSARERTRNSCNENKLLILNLNKNSIPESHRIVSKPIGIEGKLAIETKKGEILVVGVTSKRNIYTLKLLN